MNVREVAASDWTRCRRCKVLIYTKRFLRDGSVCSDCDWHGPLTSLQRASQLFDKGSWTLFEGVDAIFDPLGFVDSMPYPERLEAARKRTGLEEAALSFHGTVEGHEAIATIMDFRFMGGSLSSAVGEVIVRASRAALERRVPLILVSASGGARMQEGAMALMQMAKTMQALESLNEAGVLTISLISDPTYGGVAASYATGCDVILSEPGARFGFAGPRVIEQTIQERLPKDFQLAEKLFDQGMLDKVVHRNLLRPTLGRLLAVQRPAPTSTPMVEDPLVRDPALLDLPAPWSIVQRARDLRRPTSLEYIGHLVDGFVELHGDRTRKDCSALIGGVGHLAGRPVVVIGTEKGHTPPEMVERDFAMASPAGYRKAVRLMRLADKLGLPLITLIDTPGAYPGVDAEEQGQALRIAESIQQMVRLRVPSVAVILGEGGSGGALALGCADRTLMYANATYSVISPEGCAAILWNDRQEAPKAADKLGLDARSLLRLGIVDGVLEEPGDGTYEDPLSAARTLRDALVHTLSELLALTLDELRNQRRERVNAFGKFEAPVAEEVVV